jgi:hypothetical protein
MKNTIISTVTEHKHLGLQLSDDGNWNKHIDMQPEHFLICSVVFESWYPKQHPHILVMVL